MSQQESEASKRLATAPPSSTEQTDQRFAAGGLFLKPLSFVRPNKKKDVTSVRPQASATLSGTTS